jgi:NAD(P)-dependent dehydrogenase (short-subunit alcohol dehydrogenase family)
MLPTHSKVALITGATRGIGKATALELAQLDWTVIVHGRDQEKAAAAVAEIQAISGNPRVNYVLGDLSSQGSVRMLAQSVMDRYEQLHVLINNAAVIEAQRRTTVDGVEMTLAVNYLAPFLLTNLLTPLLLASAPARVINVAAESHRYSRLDLADLQGTRRYNSGRANGQSKLALVLFTHELARRLAKSGVTVNAAEPGVVDTALTQTFIQNAGLLGQMVRLLPKASPAQGAHAAIKLATAAELEGVSGAYFNHKGQAVSASSASYNEALAGDLWHASARLTRI